MVRLLVVLFWLGLIVGTYVTGNVLGNWVVCLLALFFFLRSRRRRDATAPGPHTPTIGPGTAQSPAAPLVPRAAGKPQLPVAQHPARPRAEQRRWH